MKTYLSVCIRTCLLLSIFLLSACSSDSDTSPIDFSSETDDFSVGRFIDAPVKGLRYVSFSHDGFTDENGRFIYVEGEEVAFYIGELFIGSAQGQSIVTPITVVGAESSRDPKVVNLIRLLQSLDEDGDPDRGIEISTATQNTFDENIFLDWSEDIFTDSRVVELLEVATDSSSPVSQQKALEHFEEQIERFSKEDFYSVKGRSEGLVDNVVLRISGGEAHTLSPSDRSFSFETLFANNASYIVSLEQVSGQQTCTLNNASGRINSANVESVLLTCLEVVAKERYSIGGSISGIKGRLELYNDTTGEALVISENGEYSFSLLHAEGSAFDISVANNPVGQTCNFADSSVRSGNLSNTDVTNIDLICFDNDIPYYFVGGTISGLSDHSSVGLALNNGETVQFSGNAFAFSDRLLSGTRYSVQIASQPDNYSCTIENSLSAISNADASDIKVNCTEDKYSLLGWVSGHASSIALQVMIDGVTSELVVPVNNAYFNLSNVRDGAEYSISAIPSVGQSCIVTRGQGQIDGADEIDIFVLCTDDPRYLVGGTVSGLTDELKLSFGGQVLQINSNGPFSFSRTLLSGESYDVSIFSEPFGQECLISNNSGQIANVSIDDINVSCTAVQFDIKGKVSGHNDTVSVSLFIEDKLFKIVDINDSGFAFSFDELEPGSAYLLELTSEPVGQNCSITNAQGTLTNDISVELVCSDEDSYLVGGTVSDLLGKVVLSNNGLDRITLEQDGRYDFSGELFSGDVYFVAVHSQPEGQICSVEDGFGTISDQSVDNVNVICLNNQYDVGGVVIDHTDMVEISLYIDDRLVDTKLVSPGSAEFDFGSFDFGMAYRLEVTAPDGQNCPITNAEGTIPASEVEALITCTNLPTYKIGGSISDLNGVLVLSNSSDLLTITDTDSYEFSGELFSGDSYEVLIDTQPEGQTCSIENYTGTIEDQSVNTIDVSCINNQYEIGGVINDHEGVVEVSLYLNDTLIDTNFVAPELSSFTFGSFDFGAEYRIELVAPTGQNCPITNAQGSVPSSSVMAEVSCTNLPTYKIGGSVGGLSGTLLLINDSDSVSISEDGSFEFSGELLSGDTYDVSIQTQPEGLICSLENETGVVESLPITNINVTCVPIEYEIKGTVLGHGEELTITLTADNVSTSIAVQGADDSFDFGTLVHGTIIELTTTSPYGKNCVIDNVSGSSLVSDIEASVTCTDLPRYKVSGVLQGLARGDIELVISKDGTDTEFETFSSDGSVAFDTEFLPGDSYSVSVISDPDTQNCSIKNSSAGLVFSDIDNLVIECADVAKHTITTTVLNLAESDSLTLTINGVESQLAPGQLIETEIFDGQSFTLSVSNIPEKYLSCAPDHLYLESVVEDRTITIACDLNTVNVNVSLDGIGSNTFSLTLNNKETFLSNSPSIMEVVYGEPFEVTGSIPSEYECAGFDRGIASVTSDQNYVIVCEGPFIDITPTTVPDENLRKCLNGDTGVERILKSNLPRDLDCLGHSIENLQGIQLINGSPVRNLLIGDEDRGYTIDREEQNKLESDDLPYLFSLTQLSFLDISGNYGIDDQNNIDELERRLRSTNIKYAQTGSRDESAFVLDMQFPEEYVFDQEEHVTVEFRHEYSQRNIDYTNLRFYHILADLGLGNLRFDLTNLSDELSCRYIHFSKGSTLSEDDRGRFPDYYIDRYNDPSSFETRLDGSFYDVSLICDYVTDVLPMYEAVITFSDNIVPDGVVLSEHFDNGSVGVIHRESELDFNENSQVTLPLVDLTGAMNLFFGDIHDQALNHTIGSVDLSEGTNNCSWSEPTIQRISNGTQPDRIQLHYEASCTASIDVIADNNLASCLRVAAEKSSNEFFLLDELPTNVNCSGFGISSLEGIQYASNIRNLDLSDNDLSDDDFDDLSDPIFSLKDQLSFIDVGGNYGIRLSKNCGRIEDQFQNADTDRLNCAGPDRSVSFSWGENSQYAEIDISDLRIHGYSSDTFITRRLTESDTYFYPVRDGSQFRLSFGSNNQDFNCEGEFSHTGGSFSDLVENVISSVEILISCSIANYRLSDLKLEGGGFDFNERSSGAISGIEYVGPYGVEAINSFSANSLAYFTAPLADSNTAYIRPSDSFTFDVSGDFGDVYCNRSRDKSSEGGVLFILPCSQSKVAGTLEPGSGEDEFFSDSNVTYALMLEEGVSVSEFNAEIDHDDGLQVTIHSESNFADHTLSGYVSRATEFNDYASVVLNSGAERIVSPSSSMPSGTHFITIQNLDIANSESFELDVRSGPLLERNKKATLRPLVVVDDLTFTGSWSGTLGDFNSPEDRLRNYKYSLVVESSDGGSGLISGAAVRIQLTSTSNTYLILTDEDGNVIGVNDDTYTSLNRSVLFKSLAPGRYYIIPATYNSGINDSFNLKVESSMPGFTSRDGLH